MSAKARGLGRGLDALLPKVDKATQMVPLAKLTPSAFQPRVRMDDAKVAELAASVAEKGVLQPLLRSRLVEAAARRQGVEASAEDIAGAVEVLRGQVRDAARQLGLLDVRAATAGEEVDLEAVIGDLIAKTARNEVPVVTLGPVSQVLRARYPSTLRDDRAVLVEQRLRELRGTGADPTAAPAPDTATD